MTLGKRIEEKRLAKNLKKKELAKLINVHDTLIGKYERDEVDLGLSKIKELARVLDTTPAFLMGWEDEAEQTAETGYSETDLRKLAESAKTFDGKPLTESDIVAIQNIIEGYLKGRL